MDAKQVARIRELSVEVRSELENAGLGVGNLGHWAKSDENGHFVVEISSAVL